MDTKKKKLYKLTDEHRAQLKPWADKWIRNALNCDPMTEADREAMRSAINGIYDAASKPRPKHIVFVPSPLVATLSGCFAAAIWYAYKHPKFLKSLIGGRSATRDATEAATRAATWAATWDATWDATWAATGAATEAATEAATWAATRAATLKIEKQPDRKAIGLYAQFLLSCLNGWSNMWAGGNQWSGHTAYLSFFRHVAKLGLPIYEKFDHWEKVTLHGGPRMMHEDFCIVSDRPEYIKQDSANRPHCETGPFCRWRDGWSLYYWHGVQVNALIIEHPEQITIPMIEKEENAEVRRIMIERYGVPKYITDSGIKPVHSDDFGTLYVKPESGDMPALAVVKVINSTPEPDGSFKDYWLRVNPELRPMIHKGLTWIQGGADPQCEQPEEGDFVLGGPQEMTARNAVASTFGLRGEHYAPAVET